MDSNKKLINSLEEKWVIKSKKIIDAFNFVDRKDFVLSESENLEYFDIPLAIWYGQTISQPTTVWFMLELLEPTIWDKILDIWSGSWWTTALLWKIVWKSWKVIWLERIDELVEFWKNNIKKYNLKNISIQKATKSLWIPYEKFNKILVSASANTIPKQLIDQLELKWILVIPIKEYIYKITKLSTNKQQIEKYPNFVFVPLIV